MKLERFTPLWLLVAGLGLLLGGLAWDLTFAGIPYQDPSPELAARYAFHQDIALTIEAAGLVLLGLGCLTGVYRRLRRCR